MKNKAYPYYTLPEITDLKDMINSKAYTQPDYTAFVYPCDSGEMKKTYEVEVVKKLWKEVTLSTLTIN